MEDIQGGYYLDELPSEQQFSILGAVQARAHAEGAQSTWADQGSSSQDRARRREADSQSIDEDHRDDLSDSDLSSWDSEDHERRLQQEWDENVRQLQTIIQIMLLPFFGKWLGRKWSYWGRSRFLMQDWSSTDLDCRACSQHSPDGKTMASPLLSLASPGCLRQIRSCRAAESQPYSPKTPREPIFHYSRPQAQCIIPAHARQETTLKMTMANDSL